MKDPVPDPVPDPASDPASGSASDNAPEYTVSELSHALKRVVEGEFGRVRVRGELGRVSRPASGHVYLDLKDDKAVLAGVIWRSTAVRLDMKPEEGLEVICSGRLTTYPGQSRYQVIIESMALAGEGALWALLARRRAVLEAQGLFSPDRKQPIPYLPEVIGVVTSPTGAVIRDILHRLAERFPRRVLIWPARVQGKEAAREIAAGVEGFNALAAGGDVPRPDVLIVARGGGSLEDLWAFNEEVVVRAAAASRIPLISAVGHETDTTLLDFAADLRAPTPTAAAEMAVPVRAELLAQVLGLAQRQVRAARRVSEAQRQRIRGLARVLPRVMDILALPRQRLDEAAGRLTRSLDRHAGVKRTALVRLAGRGLPRVADALALRRQRLNTSATLLRSLSFAAVLDRGFVLVRGPGGQLVRRAGQTRSGMALELQFADSPLGVTVDGAPAKDPRRPRRRSAPVPPGGQGSLLQDLRDEPRGTR